MILLATLSQNNSFEVLWVLSLLYLSFACIFYSILRSEALSCANSNIIKPDFASAGFLANLDKCVLDPIQSSYIRLSIVWDGVQGVMSVTEIDRLQNFVAIIDKTRLGLNLPARDLVSLA